MLEARAYSLVACGRLSEATGALDALAHCMARGTAWLLEMGRRAEHLKRLVERNPDAATDQLAQWETETATRLGVQDIA